MKKFVLISLLSLIFAPAICAATYSFERITDNAAENIEDQLKLDIFKCCKLYNQTYNQLVQMVTFTVRNEDGGFDSSISEVYFYGDVLLNMVAVDDSAKGVDFTNPGEMVTPSHLPGYDPQILIVDATEAVNPESHNGVAPSEFVKISFSLIPGYTFEDLLDSMTARNTFVGIHVKGINTDQDNDESDSFVSVPEPTTMSLFGLGAFLLARRRK